jgi:hypothetical protein
MTKHDETAKLLLMDAAQEAGYSPREIPGDEVGVIAPAKVCRLLGAIHVRLVEMLKGLDIAEEEPVNE